MRIRPFVLFLATLLVAYPAYSATAPSNPIMYVTQTPMPDEILTHVVSETRMGIVSAMQSPLGDTQHAPRGGALWIRYPGALSATNPRNLTLAAGFGESVDTNNNAQGFQGANSIAVHRPFMHWSGTKAIFSMVVGAPTSASDTTVFHWQLYEITNFGQGQTPVITLVQGQPTNYNNIEACYDTQDRIIFVSDAPRGMQAHLYPQLDEYMNTPTNTGLWRLDRANGNELKHIIHAPSGAFTPFIDSAGRVLFVQWDHLTRDVSAVYDRFPFQYSATQTGQYFTSDPADPRIETNSWSVPQGNGNGTFASEAANATFTLGTNANFAQFNNYPEPRNFDKVSLYGMGVFNTNSVNPPYGQPIFNGNALNQFFLWECREDGSSHEIINHVGRHEFGGSNLRKVRNDDGNIVDPAFTQTTALDMLHVMESPTTPGTFYACNPPELGTHMAGPIIRFTGGTNVNPSAMAITQITPNALPNPLVLPPSSSAVNVYRNPVALTDGQLLAVHAAWDHYDSNAGTATAPKSNYGFKMKMLTGSVGSMAPDNSVTLTSQPNVSLSYFVNGTLITYSNAALWELDPVEVVGRSVPSPATSPVANVEQTVFAEEGVDLPTMQNYLRTHNLAMLVNRDSTRRDSADKQQPFNLKVSWSNTQTLGAGGTIYDIGWVQLMQSDAIRGFTQSSNVNTSPLPGRRHMPIPLHDTTSEMPAVPGAPAGAVKIGDDGSWAAIVPAARAMTWHMLDGTGTKSQVKERYWVSFAPGEVRTCAVCHGVNTLDQAGHSGAPVNKPNALRSLLQFWKSNNPPGSMQHASATKNAAKNAGSVALHVTRTAGTVGPVSVNFTTVDGTATAGTDYTTTTGTLNWADGDTADKLITIPLLNPSTISTSKSLTVTLSGPLNGLLGATTTNTLTIDETPFNAWLFSNFGANANTPSGDPLGDPDGDGIKNTMEYALGGNPANGNSAVSPVCNLNASHLELSFTRSRTDVTYTVEVSGDLATWVPGSTYGPGGNTLNTPATNDVTPAGQPAGYTVVRDNTASGGGVRRFMRLRVTMP